MPLDRKPRIVVIGDIMVDVDLHCTCERICQEGPWPVLKVISQTERIGGAGNVAAMCVALDADCMTLGNSRLSRKQRLFVDGKLIGPRIDHDTSETTDLKSMTQFQASIAIFRPDAIIVADHGKGVVTTGLMDTLYDLDYPVFVDPVKMTPVVGRVESVVAGEHELGCRWKCECIILKRGADGLDWVNGSTTGTLKSRCNQCVDPLGAGDQLIATLAIRRVLGDSWKDAIETANIASGLQCERQGCVPVTSKELEAALHRIKYSL